MYWIVFYSLLTMVCLKPLDWKTSQAILCSCILNVIICIVTCVSYSLKCHYGSFVSFEGWQPRWFVLKGGTLSYYDSQEDAWKGCKGSIKISVCEIQGKGKFVIMVTSQASILYMLQDVIIRLPNLWELLCPRGSFSLLS